MTNFEKWKQGLTVDDLRMDKRDDLIALDCKSCPVEEFCNNDIDMCFDTFNTWAKQECRSNAE